MEATGNLDLRKWKSHEALKASFWHLLKDIGYAKISIIRITEDSGLNRKTFYRNYEDMEALMKEAFLELFASLSAPYNSFYGQTQIAPDLFARCTSDYIRLIQKEQNRLRLIFANHLEGFAQEVWKQMYAVSSPDYVSSDPHTAPFLADDCSLDLYSNYAAFGTWAHLEWVVRHADLPAEELLGKTMDTYFLYLYNYYVFYRIGERFAVPPESAD